MLDLLFTQFPLFQELLPEQSSLVRGLFTACFQSAGNELFQQGEAAEHLYLIVEGEVVIRFKPEDGPSLLVARVHNGGVAGWSAALGNPTYTSSACCITDCQMLCVRGQDLHLFCEQEPESGSLLLERLAKIVAERQPVSQEQVIALLERRIQPNGQKTLTTDQPLDY